MLHDPESVAEDLTLVHACLHGRPEAFRHIVEKYQDYLFDLGVRMLRDRQEAEDVVQETFLKLHQNLPDYKAGHKLSNWLYTIALNNCRSRLRRRKIIGFFSLDFLRSPGEDSGRTPFEPAEKEAPDRLEQQESEQVLEKLIAALPDNLKEPFVLRYRQELPLEDIAGMLEISVANVKVRLHRARTKLYKDYGEAFGAL